jgi:hypothetical protein
MECAGRRIPHFGEKIVDGESKKVFSFVYGNEHEIQIEK